MNIKRLSISIAALTLAFTVSAATVPPQYYDCAINMVAYAATSTYLKKGSKGSEVKTYQRNLIALNYLKAGADTGTFDDATDAATKKLQTNYNLKVDGIAGPDTQGLAQGLVNGTAKIIQVTSSNVNIRSGAGTSYNIITTAQSGYKYIYTSTKKVNNSTWYCIKVKDQVGYISGSYVKVVKITPAATTAATTTTTKATSAVTSSSTTTTTATAAPTTTTTKVTTTTIPSSGKLTITADKVNLRVGAGTSYPIIMQLKKGSTYTYSSVKKVSGKNWYYIKVNSLVSGWVCGDYVKVTMPTTTTAKTTTTTTKATTAASSNQTTTTTQNNQSTTQPVKGIVTASVLNVRKTASSSGEVIGTLTQGQAVTVVQKGSEWHKIEYGSGYGYVSADYISFDTTALGTQSLSYSTSYYYVDKGKTVDVSLSGSGIAYKSSDPTNCPVSSAGVVKGVKEGLYEITAYNAKSQATTCITVLRAPYTGIQAMTASAKGIQFIADCEGGWNVLPTGEKVFYPYRDPSGFWTIGYGHAKTSSASKQWSEEKAIAEFNKDIESSIGAKYKLTDDKPYLSNEGATKLLNYDINAGGSYAKAVSDWAIRNGVKLTQNQFDALVSFCYNLGTSYWTSDSNKFYLKSAIISYRSGSDAVPDQIIEGFCRYNKSGSKHYSGLWYRRRNEAEMFITGDYKMERGEKFKLPSDTVWY